MKPFTISIINHTPYDFQTLNLVKWQKCQEGIRKKRAKWHYKKFPAFAVEMMREKYPNYTYADLINDIKPSTKKKKPGRKGKSPLKRQGRYPLFEKAMMNYYRTKEQHYLEEAQRLRNRMFLPFLIQFRLKKEGMDYTFPSTTPFRRIQELMAIKFSSWEELDEKITHAKRFWDAH
jgi:hypothetical protein